MSEQCFGRIIRDGEANRGRFPDKHRFYHEFRCPSTIQEDQLCSRCLEWKARGPTKDLYRCHYGLIIEELPEWSHIYEGLWYLSKVAVYGQPSELEMAKAKKAQMEARNGFDIKETVVSESVKKKRVYKKKDKQPVAVEAPLVVEAPVAVEAPVVVEALQPTTLKKRRPKKQTIPEESNVQIQAVEVTPMLNDIEIVKIIVRPFRVKETAYFLDGKKNKVYSVGKDARPSSYVGRWNSESQAIDTDFPDSDAE